MEKEVIKENFGDIHELFKLPSLNECRALIHQNSCLRKRTPEQLKTWIDNQRKDKTRKKKYLYNAKLLEESTKRKVKNQNQKKPKYKIKISVN